VVTAPFEAPIKVPKSVAKEGTHTLSVTLTDTYFNTVTDEVHFSFGNDNGGPSLRLLSPTDGATLPRSTPLTIRAEASDSEGGVKYVEFYLDNTLLTRKPRDPYELQYTDNLSPGSHTAKFRALDTRHDHFP
jgi:hypothetical protein